MSLAKVLGILIFSCLSFTAHAQTVSLGKKIEIQPILLNPPFLGTRPPIDMSKGSGPIKFNKPSGGYTVGGGQIGTSICHTFVKSRLSAAALAAENAAEVIDIALSSLRSVVATIKRLEDRKYLTSIEKELLLRLQAEVSMWDESFKEISMTNCLDDDWTKISRISPEQADYLVEAVEFIRQTMNTKQ